MPEPGLSELFGVPPPGRKRVVFPYIAIFIIIIKYILEQ